MKALLREAGIENVRISSAAVSREEEGNAMYPNAQRTLAAHGIPFGAHAAHRITAEEFAHADLVVVMDTSNIRLLEGLMGQSPKVHRLMEYAGSNADVADPWYTRDFEQTYRDIVAGCKGLIASFSGVE